MSQCSNMEVLLTDLTPRTIESYIQFSKLILYLFVSEGNRIYILKELNGTDYFLRNW
jgi:hypothetical protein